MGPAILSRHFNLYSHLAPRAKYMRSEVSIRDSGTMFFKLAIQNK